MIKFAGKYRIKSARLDGYDYGQNGAYFVTICTKNRIEWFGKIVGGKIKLSNVGKIVKCEWIKTFQIRKNVFPGKFVIMPNHFHAILFIQNNPLESHCNASLTGNKNCNASQTEYNYKNKFGPQINNLPSIIRGFKGSATKQIHISGLYEFQWQPRYYDRIIRNELELERITNYIEMNPSRWNEDKYFGE